MTIGIGVMCEYGDCAILASDMRVTYGTMPIDPHDRAGKQFSFPPFNFGATMAGSTSSVHAIVSEFASQLKILLLAYVQAKEKNPKVKIQFEHIRNALEFSRKKELRRLQACAMDSELGLSLEDWLVGKLPTGQPFNRYAHAEGLRVLKNVKDNMQYNAGIIVAGFLREDAIFMRGLGASPVEEFASPANYVVGGKGAVEALKVLVNRKQNVEMGVARSLLHVYEALNAAKLDKAVGEPSSYVVIRPHTKRRPNGMQRIFPEHHLLEQWSKKYKLTETDALEAPFANQLIDAALSPDRSKRNQWLGPKELMLEL